MILLGVVGALILFGYGVKIMVTGVATLPGWHVNVQTTGRPAWMAALVYVSIGVFIHFHWFWGMRPSGTVAKVGKIVALSTLIIGVVGVAYGVLVR